MRTKNKKRIGSVPITLVAVFALAAFLSVGLLLTVDSGQTAWAQDDADCPVSVGAGDTVVLANTLTACSVTGGSAVVELPGDNGTGNDDTETVWIYAQDGTIAGGVELTNVWDHGATASGTEPPSATKFSAINLVIPPATQDIGGGGPLRSTVEITVTPDAGKSDVVLYVYYDDSPPIPAANFNHDSDTETGAVLQIDRPNDTTSGSLTITFVGAPALMDADDVVRSNLTATDISAGVVTISDNSTAEVRVTANVRDANANELTGQISYSVVYAPDSALKGGQSNYTTPLKDYPGDSDVNKSVNVGGWEASGAVRVTVSARFEGVTGNLDLTPIALTRTGDAAMITSMVYECAAMDAEGVAILDVDRCDQEAEALANDEADDDPSVAGAFDPGATFMIHSTAVDSLGSVKTIGFSATEVVAEGAEAVLGTIGTQTAAVNTGTLAVAYIQHTLPAADDIELGAYTIMVQDDDENAESTVAIIVSGPPENYMLTGPAFIPLVAFSSADYTVTVTDANGNPPTGDNTVEIIVQGIDASDVTGAGTAVPVGADGTVTFSIRVPFGAMQGDQAAIGVLVDGELKDRLIITFGEEVAPEPMLTAPTGVTATADASTVTVTWTDGADAVGHLVLLFNADFSGAPMVNAPPTGSSAEFAEFMDVAAGDYVAVVVSYRSASETAYNVDTVTVN